MADSIKLDILTPLGPKRDGVDVPGVELPGIEGELGILPQHEALVTAVVPGVIRFKERGGQSARIAVGAGFMEVKEAGRVIVLVERAVEADEVDTEAVRTRLGEVQSELAGYSGSINDADYRSLSTELAWLEAQLRAAAS